MDVAIECVDANLRKMNSYIDQAASQGARLIVFPECALTGYCFDCLDDAKPFAQPADGPAAAAIAEHCAQHNVFVVFGMLERDEERLFNAALLVGPDGLIGSYRKVHLPFLGIDRFVEPGDRPFAVHAAAGASIGMNICYDVSFPESSRILALQGADIIALPTNWPPAARCLSDYVVNTRAMENHVHYIAVNRVGEERGVSFVGLSRICEASGNTLAVAADDSEQVLYAELDMETPRNKKLVRIPGKHEIHRFNDRRPELYDVMVRPKSR
jgi:predicted amidohydrolase